ncbi:hypothetical protein B0J11DRAFT_437302 [Dendryphion nanum]|uniref:DUF6536 domain-containing protein n=1 Tax=Dendryphion nanum TaxID=256645 RepID=A0A9P9IKL7_9PLEO|nr:hypothetical protein B0J11DRAFT_437302 [Dendryphion nanum]
MLRRFPLRRKILQQHSLFVGWRFGVLISLLGVTTVCLANLSITVWAYTRAGREINQGVGVLSQGACDMIKRHDVWLHLLINILSTLLLSGSNYCMQVLSAPNRNELIEAHSRKDWLHIGVPNIGNLLRIGKDRSFLWLVLFLTSVPLHLLFNSVIFTNMQANNYIVIPSTEHWLQGGDFNSSTQFPFVRTNRRKKNLTTEDCFREYDLQYMSKFGNLILVQDEVTWRNPKSWAWDGGRNKWIKYDFDLYFPYQPHVLPFEAYAEYVPSNAWRCAEDKDSQCKPSQAWTIPHNRTLWAPFGDTVKYCMAEEVNEVCKLQFSFPIAIAVITANFIKVLCMAITLFRYRNHIGLVTLGDAIASFLDTPDPHTKGKCLHDMAIVTAELSWEKLKVPYELKNTPKRYIPKTIRWGRAPTRYRWLVTYVLYVAAVITGSIFAKRATIGLPTGITSLWRIGFGNVSGENLLDSTHPLMRTIFLANFPQAILSYLYLTFNAFYTSMFVAREWYMYGSEGKTLRVTAPLGNQRSTYWLNVPFRYAIPITVLSGLFHWLASQSFFMVQITITNPETRSAEKQISTCGYSPLAIICTVVTGTFIALVGIGLALRKFPAGMPLASSCSVLISAACHPPHGEETSLGSVRWGAVSHGVFVEGKQTTAGHCTFTTGRVDQPVPGLLYA